MEQFIAQVWQKHQQLVHRHRQLMNSSAVYGIDIFIVFSQCNCLGSLGDATTKKMNLILHPRSQGKYNFFQCSLCFGRWQTP